MSDKDDNVIPFNGLTVLDVPTDAVIDGIKDCVDRDEPVIVLGHDVNREDTLYFASSVTDRATLLLLLERAKQSLMSY